MAIFANELTYYKVNHYSLIFHQKPTLMKKVNYLLVAFTMLLGLGSLHAENISPYLADFNTAIDVSDHDFRPASGWNHITESAYIDYEDMYVTYNYTSTKGVNGSGAIGIGDQTVSGSGWYAESQELHDYLVTPAVSGAVSIMAERINYNHYLQVYKATKNADGTFTVGDQLELTHGSTTSTSINDLSAFDYDTIQIGNFSEPTYLAIRGNGVYIDNFSAETADVDLVRSLKITNQTTAVSNPDVRPDGKYPMSIAVTLLNNGDYDLNPGDENYSITVTERESGAEIGTAPISKAITKGETAMDTITVYADYATYPKQTGVKVRENISGTQYQYQSYVTPTPYEPIMQIRDGGNTTELDDSTAINFGKIQQNTTKNIIVRNSGAKALNITSITLPEGYVVDSSAFTVPAHSEHPVAITATTDETGIHNGYLTINADEVDPFHLALNATVLDSTKYYVDFENNRNPAGAIVGKNWVVSTWGVGDNNYILQNNYTDESLFITPLLKVTEGEQMVFDAGKRANTSYINVYYSADRKNWIRLDSINASRMSDEYPSSGYSYTRKYNLTTYTISGVPAGNYYIAFGSGYANLDNIYGFEVVPVSHDLAITSQSIPTTAVVNTESTAKATLQNVGANDETARSYTATLHLGDATYTADAVKLEAGTSTDFTFPVTPHKAGTFAAYIEFAFADDYKVTTDTVNVVVGEETAQTEVQVGEPTGSTSSYVPLYINYNNSESETVYTTDMLNGLKTGDKITSIVYKGFTTTTKNINTTLNVWIANTSDEPQTSSPYELANTDTMTNVFSGDYTFPKDGTSTNPAPIITVNLTEPFVYNGQNIRLIVRSENQSDYASYTFNTVSQRNSIYRNNDYHETFLTRPYSLAPSPVVYFGVQRDPVTLTGTVTDSAGNAISGAVVKLTSGNVEYSDTTEADGSYNISVMKDQLTYTLRTDAPDYEPYITDGINVTAGLTKDIVLHPATGLFIENHNIAANGTVNDYATAEITVTNDISQDIAAADYDATLYLDGVEAAKATTKADIPTGKSATLNFRFTPRKSGKQEAKIVVNYGEYAYTVSDSIVVNAENFGGEFQTGDSTDVFDESSPVAPWNNWFKQSQSVIVYTPDQLGLTAGGQITNIRFRGKLTNTNTGHEAVSLFIGNTTTEPTLEAADALFADTASMTRIYSMDQDTIDYGGSNYSRVQDIINADIPGGFTYTGGNIVVVFNGNHMNQSDNKIAYVVDENEESYAYGRQTDRGDIYKNESFAKVDFQPIMYMTVTLNDSVRGTVIDKKTLEPVSGANVTLKSGNVEYYGTTAADGTYGIHVAKTALTYDAIFAADGYITDTVKNVTFDSTIVVLNDTLARVPVIINVTGTVKGAQRHADGTTDEAQPLNGATVTVTNADGKTIATATTTADGTYEIDSLTEGQSYTLTYSAEGYTDSVATITAPDTNVVADATLYTEKVKVNVTGTVKGVTVENNFTEEPLAGATVTVANAEGTTVATATTEADGTYTISNLDEDSVYTFTFSAAGYVDSVATVTAGAEDLTVDATLYTEEALGINGINVDNKKAARGNVYTISGQYIGRNIDISTLPSGVYIINGKKVAVK